VRYQGEKVKRSRARSLSPCHPHGRAILHEPRLVLFDEPLSNLNAKLREQMHTELKLLQDRLGFTFVDIPYFGSLYFGSLR
jgi:ABC-type branched-subunit amino acid transport system ATPase component